MDGEVSPATVRELLEEREVGPDAPVRIVDVRDRAAFDRGHVPGSVCVPLGELARAPEPLDGAERVVTVCPHGQASVQAARLVAAYEGVDDDARVESMAGGLAAWEGPLERGDADRPASEGSTGSEAPF